MLSYHSFAATRLGNLLILSDPGLAPWATILSARLRRADGAWCNILAQRNCLPGFNPKIFKHPEAHQSQDGSNNRKEP